MPSSLLKKYNSIRAVLFDMDGTLYRNSRLNKLYNESIYKIVAHEKKRSLEEAKHYFEAAYQALKIKKRRELSRLYTLTQMGISDFDWAKKQGMQIGPDKLLRQNQRLRKTLLTIGAFHKIAVVTNNHHHNTMVTLKQLGVLDCFDAVLTLSESRVFKPSPKLYRMISKQLNVEPGHCLSVGDRYDLDLAPAEQIGMQSHLVTKMDDLYQLPALLTIQHPTWLKTRTQKQREMAVKISGKSLKKGHLAVLPTDTVYGLGTIPTEEAIHWIYRAKGRRDDNPMVLLISDIKQAFRYADVSEKALALMKQHWPGGLTLVLPVKKKSHWGKVTRGGRTIALRIPDHDICRQIIRKAGGALATTSANRSGHAAPDHPDGIDKKILAFSDVLVDAGQSRSGISSTVAKVTGKTILILRQGGVILD